MILNRYERVIARRYLLPGKGEGFIFLVAAISLGAVALGVAALIIVMSVMNGFRAELFELPEDTRIWYVALRSGDEGVLVFLDAADGTIYEVAPGIVD